MTGMHYYARAAVGVTLVALLVAALLQVEVEHPAIAHPVMRTALAPAQHRQLLRRVGQGLGGLRLPPLLAPQPEGLTQVVVGLS